MENFLGFVSNSLKNVKRGVVEYSQSERNQHNFEKINGIQCKKPTFNILEDQFTELPDWAEALFAVGNIILIIFSLCGNIGALLVISKSKLSKWSTKSYLISLALFDLILTITSPTVDLSQLMSRYGGWIFGSFLCKAIPFVQTVAVMGVAFCLVVIAVERYLSVVRSFDPPAGDSKWRRYIPAIAVSLIWILAIGCALPNIWYYERVSYWTYIVVNGGLVRPRNETCDTTYYACQRTLFDERNVGYYSALGFTFLILTACFTFCYISILIFVRKHGKFRKASPTMASQAARNHKTLKLILGLILLYLVCRVPLWTYVVVTNTKKTEVTILTLSLFYSFHILSNMNTLANPFIYAIFNESIRSNQRNAKGFHGQVVPKNNRCLICCCRRKSLEHACGDNPPTFLDESVNKYDLTKQNKFIPSISTQKFFLSDRNEFHSPINSGF